MKILFTGDINFRGISGLTPERARKILAEVRPYLDAVDYRIPNLECPLGNKDDYTPIYKSGPNLICSADNICFLEAFGTDAVTLANNHIGDYGEKAVKDTLALLDENGIMHAGAGKNKDEAYKAVRLKKDGVTISVISICENEFGIATKDSYGSAGYDARALLKSIKLEKSISDYVVVVFHGGNEYNPLPSPDTTERYRLICDMGADAVIGGHTHCPQGYEVYNGKPIIYSMGNFLFASSTPLAENNSWYYGYMTVLDISDGISFEIIPYKFDQSTTLVKVFDGEQKAKMLDYIGKLSEIIYNEKLLELYFKGWAHLHPWCPSVNSNDVAGSLNLVRCEAHYSQLKAFLYTNFANETDIAKEYAEKITALCEMPVSD